MKEEPRRKSILVIINPISGVSKKGRIEQRVREGIDPERYAVDVVFTERAGHAVEITKEAVHRLVDVVVAVGGDGTVNEVASGVVGSSTALAIIPAGSGNGLARNLKIPMNLQRAIAVINRGVSRRIDTASINGEFFVNIAGLGFDASVAKKFAVAPRRGFISYFQITTNSYKGYEPKKYTLMIDGQVIRRKALMVSFANSNQWGNNITIDPGAKLDDGMIDVCIVQKVPIWKTLLMAPLLFMQRFDKTSYVEIFRAREVKVIRKKGRSVHVDGDPMVMGKELDVKINPLSLIVIVP